MVFDWALLGNMGKEKNTKKLKNYKMIFFKRNTWKPVVTKIMKNATFSTDLNLRLIQIRKRVRTHVE